MSSPREAPVVPDRSKRREIVTGFDLVKLKAPFALRCAAVFIDYIIVAAVPVLSLVFDRVMSGSNASGASILTGGTAWLIAVLVGVSNLILFPSLSGQTLGMMLSGLRIVRKNGRDASFASIALRNTVGYILTLLTGGIGFLIAAITPTGRSLHDYLAGTAVVFAIKRRKQT
jgi:uncharacterized RDD family membrane protein YckC